MIFKLGQVYTENITNKTFRRMIKSTNGSDFCGVPGHSELIKFQAGDGHIAWNSSHCWWHELCAHYFHHPVLGTCMN